MSHTAITVTISLLCTGAMYALMAAGGARTLDLLLVGTFAGLMAAACALAGFSSPTEEEPCKPPFA